MDLRGGVALVTGGNGGLGQRICHALAKEGVHVAVMYARSRDQAEGVARELASRHQINAKTFACDITDAAAVERVVGDVIGHFGRLDILVNDAAYNKAIPFAGQPKAAGNICTEELVLLCEEMGIDTGVDLDALIEVGRMAEEIVGHQLPGELIHAGSLDAFRRRAA